VLPSPYWIENVPLLLAEVEDADAEYFLCGEHPDVLQLEDGTHKSAEPLFTEESALVICMTKLAYVSKSIKKLCPGVPIVTVPAQTKRDNY
jgi:hypothetical protein